MTCGAARAGQRYENAHPGFKQRSGARIICTTTSAKRGAQTNRLQPAILEASLVGYSPLMAADEGHNLAAREHHRKRAFKAAVAADDGRILELMDDGTLVEFNSEDDAVNRALAILDTLCRRFPVPPTHSSS